MGGVCACLGGETGRLCGCSADFHWQIKVHPLKPTTPTPFLLPAQGLLLDCGDLEFEELTELPGLDTDSAGTEVIFRYENSRVYLYQNVFKIQ